MSPKVLVVDDEPMLLSCLSLYLEDAGCRVMTAPDGTTALERIQASQPDVLVCDLFMPDMNGIELCQRVKQIPEWQDIRMILLTAQLEPAHLQQGQETGIDSYLIKPFEPEDLVSAVRNGRAAKAKA
jgi:CheY-like chemotaxis protein